jgi:hypothetical protein
MLQKLRDLIPDLIFCANFILNLSSKDHFLLGLSLPTNFFLYLSSGEHFILYVSLPYHFMLYLCLTKNFHYTEFTGTQSTTYELTKIRSARSKLIELSKGPELMCPHFTVAELT